MWEVLEMSKKRKWSCEKPWIIQNDPKWIWRLLELSSSNAITCTSVKTILNYKNPCWLDSTRLGTLHRLDSTWLEISVDSTRLDSNVIENSTRLDSWLDLLLTRLDLWLDLLSTRLEHPLTRLDLITTLGWAEMNVHAFMNELDQKDYWYPRRKKIYIYKVNWELSSYDVTYSGREGDIHNFT